jgi:hypothetical protein
MVLPDKLKLEIDGYMSGKSDIKPCIPDVYKLEVTKYIKLKLAQQVLKAANEFDTAIRQSGLGC